MANIISDETMDYVGILAKLDLNEEEKEAARCDMQKMLDYVDKLNELDTSRVEPMTHIFSMGNVFRDDVVEDNYAAEELLAAAATKCDGYVVVPRVVED